MAKAPTKTKSTPTTVHVIDDKPRRKGVHAKRGSARIKSSKNYKKKYRGQGRRR
jgi:hypothetical protein